MHRKLNYELLIGRTLNLVALILIGLILIDWNDLCQQHDDVFVPVQSPEGHLEQEDRGAVGGEQPAKHLMELKEAREAAAEEPLDVDDYSDDDHLDVQLPHLGVHADG